jgi:PAS domain S-box-containing protein
MPKGTRTPRAIPRGNAGVISLRDGAPATAVSPESPTEGEARDLLAAIVESSDDAIIGESLDGLITSWNHGAQEMFGYKAEEIIGKPVATLAWPGHEEDVHTVLRRVSRGERVDHYETIRRTKDGHQLTLSLTVSPIRNSAGVIVGASKIARDITPRRESERSRALLAAIVESSDDAIISKDLNGIVTSWNSGAERMFGYTAEEMVGNPISRIAPLAGENDMAEILARIRKGEPVNHYEAVRRCKDGREIEVSLTVSPVRDATGTIIGASKIARDITLQKKTEAAMRQAEKLAATGRMAASIAHEINNPLEALTNLLYLLDKEEMGQEARQYLTAAQRELARVAHITAQTLSFHRSLPDPANITVTDLLEAALSLHQGRITTTGVQVQKEYGTVPALGIDPVELRQVLFNFLGNALDAMPGGGRLRLRVRRVTQWSTGAPAVCITVGDTGSGMSAETRRRMFEPFYTTKGATGTGLGLWIASELVAKCKGRISVHSSCHPGRCGTVFSLLLPVSAVAEARRPVSV